MTTIKHFNIELHTKSAPECDEPHLQALYLLVANKKMAFNVYSPIVINLYLDQDDIEHLFETNSKALSSIVEDKQEIFCEQLCEMANQDGFSGFPIDNELIEETPLQIQELIEDDLKEGSETMLAMLNESYAVSELMAFKTLDELLEDQATVCAYDECVEYPEIDNAEDFEEQTELFKAYYKRYFEPLWAEIQNGLVGH